MAHVLLPPGCGMFRAARPDKMKANTQNILTWMLWIASGTAHSSCPISVPFKEILGKGKVAP